MKYNNFEKHISESFLHDSAAVDTDALIASLGIPVAMEPSKKVAWWMIAGLALLSLLVVGLYYFINVPTSTTLSDAQSSMTAKGMNEESNESTLLVAEQEESINDNTNDQEINASEVIVNDELTNGEVIESKVIESVVNDNPTVISETSYTSIESNSNYLSAEKTARVSVANTSSRNFLRTDNSTNSTSTNIVVPSIDSDVVNIESEIIMESDKTILTDKNRMVDAFSPLSLLESEVVSEAVSPGLKEPECPSFSYRIPWNLALLAEVGVMKPMKDLENVGNANTAFDLRDNNESSKEAIQVGLHLKVSKGSNPLYVRGGAAYTRIAEQMNEEYDYIELDTTRGLISVTTSMTGDTVTAIYGDIVSETRFTGKSVKHYFLHLLDIPVAVGYEKQIGGSFYVGAEVGVQLNIRTSGSGLIFRDTNDYADLSEVTTKETKVGMSYFGGFHFGKHLSKRSSIQLSARFRYYPSKFSTVDPNIEQRYNLAGVHAGYVFRF